MHSSHTIFQFEDPVAFLNAQLRERQLKDPKFSLRAWSRMMGYDNPSLVFHVLRGERRLKMDLALKMAATLNLKGKALRYFELLVLTTTCQSQTEKRMFKAMLAKLRPKTARTTDEIALEVFAATSEWYHTALMTMLDLEDFNPDPAWIQERLGGDPDKKTIKQALERLVQLKLIQKTPDGKYSNINGDNPYFVANDIPSEAIRRYHAQMIEKAKSSVEQQTIEERQLRGTTIAFKKEDMSKVAEIISEAHAKVLALGVTNDAEEVYQFNSQFFRLTKKKVERTH